MIITIGILFCDKDFKYIENLIALIKEKVLIPYELIFFDNRNDISEDISFLNEYKVLNTGNGNKFQVEGRKSIIQEAKGNYIWFIDADDEPLKIDDSFNDLLELNYDLFSFNYEKDFNPEICDVYKEDQLFEKTFTDNLCYRDAYQLLVNVLWNKWIKTEVLKKASELIPSNTNIIANEDLMLLLAVLKSAQTEYRSCKFIYKNNSLRGSSGIDDYSGNLEKYERCIFGINEATEIIEGFLTPEEKSNLNLNDIKLQDCVFFTEKIAFTTDEETRNKMFEILENTFSKETISATWKQYLVNGWKFNKQQYEILVNLLFQNDYDLFEYSEIETIYIYDDGTTETKIEKELIKPFFLMDEMTI